MGARLGQRFRMLPPSTSLPQPVPQEKSDFSRTQSVGAIIREATEGTRSTITDARQQALFQAVDTDHSGVIDNAEFRNLYAAMKKEINKEHELEEKLVSTAAAAKRRSGKGGNAFPWHISLLILLVAVGATYFITRSPAAPPAVNFGSKADRDASSSSDPEFQPQTRDEQCASWKRDGECENSPCSCQGLEEPFPVLHLIHRTSAAACC